MEGNFLLKGQDIAPIPENWSARPSVGSEGFTLTFPTESKTLAMFIDAANSNGA